MVTVKLVNGDLIGAAKASGRVVVVDRAKYLENRERLLRAWSRRAEVSFKFAQHSESRKEYRRAMIRLEFLLCQVERASLVDVVPERDLGLESVAKPLTD